MSKRKTKLGRELVACSEWQGKLRWWKQAVHWKIAPDFLLRQSLSKCQVTSASQTFLPETKPHIADLPSASVVALPSGFTWSFWL